MQHWKIGHKKATQRALPSWSYDSRQTLWNIRISDDDLVLIEERDTEARTAAFACAHSSDGGVLWRDLRFEEPWWISLADMVDGVAYFQGYRRPDMPGPLGIYAVDLTTGAVRWHNGEYVFQFVVDADVFVSQPGFSGAHYFILDAANGALVKDIGTDDTRVSALRAELNEIDRFKDYRYPQNFDETHPEYEELHALVDQLVNRARVVGSLDVLAAGPHVCAAWHENAEQAGGGEPAFDQYILIADRATGELQFADQLHTMLPVPAADSFFLRKGLLYHLKDRHILKVHTLSIDILP